MPTQFTGNVVHTLARHLGVSTREIALSHDLYRDWGLTPLSLVIVLLDLERGAAIELPCQEFSGVRTVADLIGQYRRWAQVDEYTSHKLMFKSSRSSRSARNERRLRRELHRLRWLEQNLQRRTPSVSRSSESLRDSGMRRLASR
ncbi:MAG TPA: acyl carrier protein [Polyangiaceae bacterium]|nr:acyl carrier protein [Polyangiaceae bacterium]